MITALNTCKLIKTRSAKQGQEGRWGWESSCVACNFFFGSICMLFFPGFSPGLHFTASSRSTQVFSRGIYMDRLFSTSSSTLVNIPSDVYYKVQWLLFLQMCSCGEFLLSLA